MPKFRIRTIWAQVSDRRGNVALIVALVLPMLLVVGMGAIELNQVLADQRATQNVADAAALMGAGQLGVTPSGADQRAQAFALAQLGKIQTYATVSVSATAGQNSTMSVAIDTQRASFFGSLFPPGGFHTHVSSTAKGENTVPLCVLSIQAPPPNPLGIPPGPPMPLPLPSLANGVQVGMGSQLLAGACLVHSNSGLLASPTGQIEASANEAGTTATGSITQVANTQAPNLPDPFSSVNTGTPSCLGAQSRKLNGSAPQVLNQTVYGALDITGNPTVTLGPGPHYFCGNLSIGGNATLTGQNTTLVFEPGATLQPSGSATINLQGAQTGPLAGFVIVVDRNVNTNFTLNSDYFTGLTGTVYAPNAPLTVNGTKVSGATTPWTVIVAQNVTVGNGVQLVINANYSSSNVPVPVGVGSNRQNVQLIQ